MYISVSFINGLYFTFVWVFSRLYCYQQDLLCLLFLSLNLSGFNMSFVKCGSYESCRIAGYTPDLRREEVEDSLRLALKYGVKFVQVKHGMADITFSFNSKGRPTC